MALSKEEFEALIKQNVSAQCAELGIPSTEAIQEQVDERVKAAVEEIKKAFIPPTVDPGEDPKAGYKCFSEYLMDIRRANVSHGRDVNPRLTEMMKKAEAREKVLKTAGTPSMTISDAESGAYLIPDEFRATLLEVGIERSDFFGRAVMVPMAMNAINIPAINGFDHSSGYVHGALDWKWLDEEADKTSTTPKFMQVGLRLKKTAGFCYLSDELLEDSPISIEPLVQRLFSDALAWQLDWVALNGTGAGQPLGLINAPCLITHAKETNQTADTIVTENILGMYSRLWSRGRPNAIWIANHNTFTQLATMAMDVGTGGAPTWLPANGVAGRPYDTLMGLPLILSEHCRTVGDLGDIYLADWTQYLVGHKGAGMTPKFDTSIHLKFLEDQTAFRFVLRLDGQPWWPSAITTRYGTSSWTLGPFIALAARA